MEQEVHSPSISDRPTSMKREPKLRTIIESLIESDAPAICYDGLGHKAEGIRFAMRNNAWARRYADKIIVRSLNTNLYLIHKDRI